MGTRRARHFKGVRFPPRSLRLGHLGPFSLYSAWARRTSADGGIRKQDVTELLGKRDEILEKDLLWTRVVGQEQASLQRAHIRAPTECLCESGR